MFDKWWKKLAWYIASVIVLFIILSSNTSIYADSKKVYFIVANQETLTWAVEYEKVDANGNIVIAKPTRINVKK